MALIETQIGNLKGTWDTTNKKWHGNPEVINNQTIEIDLLGTISDPEIVTGLLQYQDEFDKWVSKRPTLQALLNKGTVTFDNFKLAILRQIIETDKNSTFNPLGTGLANVLNGLLDQLEAKLNA